MDVKGSDSWTVLYIHGSGETGAGYNPDSREVMRNERKRGCIVAWREADLSLLVFTFNETLRPRMCVYCKLLRLVSLKQTDEQGIGLLRIYKTQQKSPSLLIQYAHHMNQNELFLIRILVLQIAFMHMWFWPCTPRPPLTLWLMVLGWDERPRLTVQQLILLSATFLMQTEWDWAPPPPPALSQNTTTEK